MSDKLFANIAPAAPEKEKPAAKPATAATTKDKVDAAKEAPAKKPEAPKAAEPEVKEAPKAASAPVVPTEEIPSAPEETDDVETPKVDKLAIMKGRADIMGISYKPDVTADYLEALIDMKLAEGSDKPAAPSAPTPAATVSGDAPTKSLRQHIIEENMKLVRIRLINLDQKDTGLNGDIFTVSNEYLGEVRRFVPYKDTFYENGYHVENCILKQLKDKKFLKINVTKNAKGQEVIEKGWVRKFAIEIMDPLTPEELERIRISQLQSGSTSD